MRSLARLFLRQGFKSMSRRGGGRLLGSLMVVQRAWMDGVQMVVLGKERRSKLLAEGQHQVLVVAAVSCRWFLGREEG